MTGNNNNRKKDPVSVRKTYGVYGMLEWHTVFRIGGREVSVPFTGGALTGLTIRPATFATDNEVLQYVIEHSRAFCTGRIRRLS